jgi:excisionase family DNA binding protein
MVEADIVDLVRVLARQLPDMAIAAILNRSGKLTGRGATWTRTNVCGLRNTNDIPVYCEGERAERGEVTLDEAADILKVSRATAYRMVSSGVLAARQLCAGAPWIIRLADQAADRCMSLCIPQSQAALIEPSAPAHASNGGFLHPNVGSSAGVRTGLSDTG